MDFKIKHHYENFMSLLTPAPYIYNINASKNEAHPVESLHRRTDIKEFLDPYYGSGKSYSEMKDRGCIPKNELNDLINGYLEDLNKLILKLQRGKNYILGNCNRKGTVIPALKDSLKPRKMRPTVTEVLDTYYVSDEPEKKPPHNVAFRLGLDLNLFKCYLTNVTTLCKTAEVNYVNRMVETSRGYKTEIKKGNLMDLQKTAKMDNVTKIELDELKQKEKMKLKNVPEDVFQIEDYYWNGLKANKNMASDCHPKLYTLNLSWNGASKEEIMAFDLDVNPIEDNRSETKDPKSLKDNYRENSRTKP
ncbi:44289_t:CDS:2, partial [Gigaspora margarita]